MDRIEFLLALWLASAAAALWFDDLPLAHKAGLLLLSRHCPLFVAGCICFLIYRDGPTWRRWCLYALSYLNAIWSQYLKVLGVERSYGTDYSVYVTSIAISVFFGIFALLAIRQMEGLNRRAFMLVGGITYPLYLIHQDLGYGILNHLAVYTDKWIALVAVTSGMIAFAKAIEVYAERPGRKHLSQQIGRFERRIATRQRPA